MTDFEPLCFPVCLLIFHLSVIFRKLCIWKGIYPRDPKKKIKGNHQTYYHTKDVAFILHDPLLNKHREIRAHEKKIRKARAKKNMQRAFRLEQNKPTYNLDRQIIERCLLVLYYQSFCLVFFVLFHLIFLWCDSGTQGLLMH